MVTNKNLPEGFYALPPGVSPENAEKYFQDRIEKARVVYRDAIYELVVYYSIFGKKEISLIYLNKFLDIASNNEERAFLYLAFGQVMEKLEDFPKAVEYYSNAKDEGTSDQRTNYFIHNNLGFSLNTIGKYQEGEECCRKAIIIDPNRYNAYKNLGISLEGQDDFEDAASCYMEATRKSALMKGTFFDTRAGHLLSKLLFNHPEVLKSNPILRNEWEGFRKQFNFAGNHYDELKSQNARKNDE